jgi:hypothetical protein
MNAGLLLTIVSVDQLYSFPSASHGPTRPSTVVVTCSSVRCGYAAAHHVRRLNSSAYCVVRCDTRGGYHHRTSLFMLKVQVTPWYCLQSSITARRFAMRQFFQIKSSLPSSSRAALPQLSAAVYGPIIIELDGYCDEYPGRESRLM